MSSHTVGFVSSLTMSSVAVVTFFVVMFTQEDDDVDQCDDIYLQTETGYTCLTSWPQE